MPNIPIQDARGVFTKQLLESWNELMELMPTSFLQSFFTKSTSDTKEVSIEVRRGTEKIAVDVHRGTDGNRNQISLSTERIYVPPFYNETIDATNLDRYDLMFGQGVNNVAPRTISTVVNSALEELQTLKKKIERAYELQCSQVLTNGIVQINAGENIDFKRKAGSMLAKTAPGYWTVVTIDPRTDLADGCKWLRQTGRAGDGEFHAILGDTVASALIANPFIDNDKIKTLPLVELNMPQMNAEGSVYLGMLACGAYKVHLWTYPQYYDNASGVSTPYVPNDQYFLIPKTSGKFRLAHASVPVLLRDIRNAEFPELIAQAEADYVINNYIDPPKKKHVFEIMSSGVAVPVSVDRIYSSKVTA